MIHIFFPTHADKGNVINVNIFFYNKFAFVEYALRLTQIYIVLKPYIPATVQLNKSKKVGKILVRSSLLLLLFLVAAHSSLDRNESRKFHFISLFGISFAQHGVTIKLDCYLNFDLTGFWYGSVRFGSLTGWMVSVRVFNVAHFRLKHLLSTQIRV